MGKFPSLTRRVLHELRRRQAVTHRAKTRQSEESHFNLKHRPVGVGSAEPTHHVPRDDVTPFHVQTDKQEKTGRKKNKTYRSYWERHPCLSLHV